MSLDSFDLFISGDFCPSEGQIEILSKQNPEEVFGKLHKEISSSDLAITNLECPLTESVRPILKAGPNLKSNPRLAEFLSRSGIRLVTLANNHIFDYGQRGIEDTIHALTDNGIEYVGAGHNLEKARCTFYKKIREQTLAVVNFCEIEYNIATSKHGGANPMDVIDGAYQIQEASRLADIVIVIIHGGHEHYHYPSPGMVKRYRFWAEQGAHAVIGHHTHCVGPYEIHKDVPIFYSLGNFLFDWKNCSKSWYEGYAVRLVFRKNAKVHFKILPYKQCCNGAMKLAVQDETSRLAKEIEQLCCDLNSPELLEEKWKEFSSAAKFMVLKHANHCPQFVWRLLRKLGLTRLLLRRKDISVFKHFMTSAAYHEKGVRVLSDWLERTEQNRDGIV